jgi:LDH2 family malate/lactate/ureidoglycolate dehydrogenase
MRIDSGKLQNVAVDILMACGESRENAEMVAECMIRADLRGITTHGTYLLTPIYKRYLAKQLSLPTKISVIKSGFAASVIDGGDGLGAVAGKKAVELTLESAKKYGIGTTLIRQTNNIGSLACYTEMAAKQGTIAFMCCNAAPAMAPWGGAEPYIGTNPIAFAIYTGQELVFSADMASSLVARGKIRKALRDGKSIPADWAIDEDGNFTTDPAAALKGCLLPIGGPKGAAIALMVDIVSGLLSGSSYAKKLKSFHEPEGSTGVGAFMVIINIENFMPLKKFEKLIQDYISSAKALKKAKGSNEIFLPGEIEQNREKQYRISGIELDINTINALKELLMKTGSAIRLT